MIESSAAPQKAVIGSRPADTVHASKRYGATTPALRTCAGHSAAWDRSETLTRSGELGWPDARQVFLHQVGRNHYLAALWAKKRNLTTLSRSH